MCSCQKSAEINIVGLGVSGSYLAWRLSSSGFRVRGFDVVSYYRKPCGDAFTLRPWIRDFLEEFDVVETYINKYIIKVNNKEIYSIKVDQPLWYIANKRELINKLRLEIIKNNSKIIKKYIKNNYIKTLKGIIIDARGPYAHNKSSWIIAYRLIAKEKWDPHTAILDFYPELKGLFWLFPSDDGRHINFGAGFNEFNIKKTREFALKRAILNGISKINIIEEKAAPIAVYSKINLIDKKIIKIGEAAGLVISTAGEGNRPGLESANILYNAFEKEVNIIKYYKNNNIIKKLMSESKASRFMLEKASNLGKKFINLALALPRDFWERYLSASIDFNYLIKVFIKNPKLLKYIL